MPRSALSTFARGLTAALCIAGLSACGGKKPPVNQPVVRPVSNLTESPVRNAQVGLEVAWWLADDTAGRVGTQLTALGAAPLALDDATRARWEAAGFRVLTIPLGSLPALQGALPRESSWTRRWHAQLPDWAEVFRGRRIAADTRVLIDRAPERLPGGSLRLLARNWAVPGEPPALHLDAAVQLLTNPPALDPFALEEPRVSRPADEGHVLGDLVLSTELPPTVALIITAEAPGVVWSGPTGAAPAPAPEQPESLLEAEGEPNTPIFGPLAADALSLGQTMLTAGADEPLGKPVKALVVLIPRLPARYSILNAPSATP